MLVLSNQLGIKKFVLAIASSLGLADAGKLIKTNSSGKLDNSIIKDSVLGFESIVWNHNSYPEVVNIVGGILISKTWTTPLGSVTMTNNYDMNDVIISKVLTGSVPAGIAKTKTYNYSGNVLTGKVYS